MANDLKAREGDVASLQEQKRALESEMLRAQRALSRGAVESASMAQGEVMLQVPIFVMFVSIFDTVMNEFDHY